ncbi:MAG: hypothetical protein CME21_18045, partial [Gemmatimonadetes bacterium]|nr:hypothetical protein [Gemmatimonadota bacterium]
MKVHARIWMTLFVIVPYAFWVDIYEGALLPRLLLVHVALSTIAVTAAVARRRSLVPQKVVILTILFIAFLLLSLLQSQNITESFVHLSQYGSLALLPLLMCFSVGAQDLMPLYRSIAIASIPISLLGIGQYLGIFPFDLPAHAHPSATFFHRNAAATYLTAIVPISALCFLTSSCDRKRWVYGSATWLALAFLVFTRTRGAWVGALVAGLTVFGLNRALGDRVGLPSPTAHRLFAMIATVVVLGSVIIPDRIPGGSAFDDKKASAAVAVASIVSEEGHRGRTELWKKTVDIIADHPILGVGLGNWEFQFPAYADGQHLNVDAAPRRPHNDLLWLASET